MRKRLWVSQGLLFAAIMGCTDPSGPGVDSNPLETSAGLIFGGGASISLEKSTNGQDADESPGPSVTPGDPVVWEYRVMNTGTESLSGVYVMDDREGLICTIGPLDAGQNAVCSLEKEAQVGPYANLGTAYGYASLFSVKASDPSHYLGETSGARAPTVLEVEVQIKPGNGSPRINPSSRGRTPVAILASAEFDPLAVDPNSILAGGVIPPVRWGRGEDVSGDGLLDLVVHFRTQELNAEGLLQDGTELVISGETFEGVSFAGSDMVRVTGGSKGK